MLLSIVWFTLSLLTQFEITFQSNAQTFNDCVLNQNENIAIDYKSEIVDNGLY